MGGIVPAVPRTTGGTESGTAGGDVRTLQLLSLHVRPGGQSTLTLQTNRSQLPSEQISVPGQLKSLSHSPQPRVRAATRTIEFKSRGRFILRR